MKALLFLPAMMLATAFADNVPSPVGRAMDGWKDAKDLCALSSAVFDGKRTLTDTFGYADVESGRRPDGNDLFWIASNTKAVACALVLTYVDEGKIALEDPVERYLPEWKDMKVRVDGREPEDLVSRPTVRQLMGHRSGLRFFPGMPISQYPVRLLAHKAVDAGLQSQPGTKYSYSNWGIDCAVAICEVVGGKCWDVLLRERILDPLGMKGATFFPNAEETKRIVTCYSVADGTIEKVPSVNQLRLPYDRPPVYAEAGGGLFATADDMLRFFRMLANRGVSAEGRRILSEKTMDEWYGTSAWWKAHPVEPNYTFGANVDPARGTIGHGGAFGTFAQANWKHGTARVYFVQQCGNCRRSQARRQAWDAATAPYFQARGTEVEGTQDRRGSQVAQADCAMIHCHYAAQSLAGAWEMAYRPEPWTAETCPAFAGVRIDRAVPGYWEDLLPALRAAGLKDEIRINPEHVEQTFPMTGWAKDTTLPNPYGAFLYRRTFATDRTGPALLAFDCVRNEVRVWINGRFVAHREGFSTPFELAVPDGVLRAGENEIVLAVANTPNRGYNGRNVSGMLTRSIYGATGGIDGRVELRFPSSDLADACVTTAPDLKTFTIRVVGRDRYRYEIRDGETVKARGAATGDVTLPSAGYGFWSPENPKRYTLRIVAPDGTVAEQAFGLRRLTADGERLRLNGRPVYLRGVTEHGYFAKTVHVPRDLGYWRMVAAKRKELGFNFVRFHTFVPPVEYLEATDELGMLVQIETPNFVPVAEYAAAVAFARRHPSVVIYSTGNETQITCAAETYLEAVAGLVHRETDSLFSPMSALRGVEYFIVEGKDPYVNEPIPHNRERVVRLSRYCDLFNSYQLGVTSYLSLNKGTSRDLDRWGDAFCGKPRLSHEICIDSTYADFSLEKLYPPDSPLVKAGIFSKPRDYLRSLGLLDRADRYYLNSCEWMRRIRKFTFEKLRAADRVAGFDFLGDINTHWHTFGYSVGMMDEFYRLKAGETVENALRYNSPAVLLADLGSDFNVRAGGTKRIRLSVSNYADEAPDAKLTVRLGEFVRTFDLGRVPNGRVSPLVACDVPVPATADARKYLLGAEFAGGAVRAANEWEIYAFPPVPAQPAPPNVRIATTLTEAELTAAMKKGERVLLLGAGPFRSLPTTYRIGMAGRCSGNYATVIKAGHPALEGFPHEGFCGWQFRRMMEGGAAVQLEAGVPFDPVVDVASAVKCAIRQAALFEYRIGAGRLLVCSFKLAPDDPAAAWLKAGLVRYAASEAFRPAQSLTIEQLHAVLTARHLSAEENSNFARNANDPSAVVDEKDAK